MCEHFAALKDTKLFGDQYLFPTEKHGQNLKVELAVADAGFPVGGGGGADLRHIHFLAKMYAKMKEMDPVAGGGGARWRCPLDLPMVRYGNFL